MLARFLSLLDLGPSRASCSSNPGTPRCRDMTFASSTRPSIRSFLLRPACSVRGWAPVVLGERHLASRALGATLIVLGVALLALSPSR